MPIERVAPQRVYAWFACLIWVFIPCPAAPEIAQTTQSVGLHLQALGRLTVPAAVGFSPAGPRFTSFQAALPVSFRARTSPTGSGNITLQVVNDFTPAGGPSVAAGALTYTCSAATLGTACAGSLRASVAAQTPVLSIPANSCTGGGPPCSGSDPNTVNVNFMLDNDPAFETGTYSAQVLLTISAI